jgi:hypothetical protein
MLKVCFEWIGFVLGHVIRRSPNASNLLNCDVKDHQSGLLSRDYKLGRMMANSVTAQAGGLRSQHPKGFESTVCSMSKNIYHATSKIY